MSNQNPYQQPKQVWWCVRGLAGGYLISSIPFFSVPFIYLAEFLLEGDRSFGRYAMAEIYSMWTFSTIGLIWGFSKHFRLRRVPQIESELNPLPIENQSTAYGSTIYALCIGKVFLLYLAFSSFRRGRGPNSMTELMFYSIGSAV